MVFRTNTAYNRFWEGRKIWEKILNSLRDLGRMTVAYGDIIQEERVERVLHLLCAFPLGKFILLLHLLFLFFILYYFVLFCIILLLYLLFFSLLLFYFIHFYFNVFFILLQFYLLISILVFFPLTVLSLFE